MLKDFEKKLDLFAELIVKVGINIQPNQKLVVNGKNFTRGVPLEAAPLMRRVVHHAYKAGARYVDVIWDDVELTLERLDNAPKDSFEEFPTWRTRAMEEYLREGNALMTVYANDPDKYKAYDTETLNTLQRTMEKNLGPAMEHLMMNIFNWCLIAIPVPGWATKLFPNAKSTEEAMELLWEKIFTLCRLDQPDPVKAWQDHIHNLHSRGSYLTDKKYDALHYTGPGTDFTLGLPDGHIWESAQIKSTAGVPYVANLPTEEVFSMPHKDRADGTVTATLPLVYSGVSIEDFSITFKNGRAVDYKAKKGGEALKALLDSDEGSHHLGEVALVPDSSPISRSRMMFYNTLFDENAACHLALGRAYRSTMKGGEQMSADQFSAAGGNDSSIHEDFMIGSGKLDIDGLTKDGKAEPILRQGEWAFEVK